MIAPRHKQQSGNRQFAGGDSPSPPAAEGQSKFAGMLATAARQATVPQWLIVGVACAVLGVYVTNISILPARFAPLSVLGVLFVCAALVVPDVRKLLLAVIILDIPIQLDIHLSYRTDIPLGDLGGWDISATTMALVLLYASWLAQLLARFPGAPRPRFRVTIPLALFLAFATLSAVVAHDAELSMFEVFLLVQMFLLYLYIVSTVRTQQDVLFLVTMLLVSLFLESAIILGLSAVGREIDVLGIGGRVEVRTGYEAAGPAYRVAGTLGSPNNAASFVSLLLPVAISVLLSGLGRWYKCLAALAFCAGLAALILTFSRGGWIAFAVSMTIVCLLAWRRGWLAPAIPLVIAGLVLLVGLLFAEPISSRLVVDQSAESRVPLIELAFRIIRDHPLFGIGVNNFMAILKQYVTPEFDFAWLAPVHNKYLLVWAETGIGGLVAFVLFLLVTLRRGWQSWGGKNRLLCLLGLGLTAGIAGQMAHMLVDIFQSRPQVELLWIVAALVTAIYTINLEWASEEQVDGVEAGSRAGSEGRAPVARGQNRALPQRV
ncbi:MAG: O-antigen ligase family protein [Chloroflexia bacterium]